MLETQTSPHVITAGCGIYVMDVIYMSFVVFAVIESKKQKKSKKF
jgi:hypothetical protein